MLQSLLAQTSAHDPLTLVAIATVVAIASLAARVVPARRATSIDPMRARRYQ